MYRKHNHTNFVFLIYKHILGYLTFLRRLIMKELLFYSLNVDSLQITINYKVFAFNYTALRIQQSAHVPNDMTYEL